MTDWRNEAAAGALARYLDAAPVRGPTLVLGDPDGGATRAVEDAGARARRWDRRLREGAEVSPWPPGGPFAAAVLRLPKAKDELEMLVHASAARLEPGGTLLVYGANDEGIRSADRRIAPLLGDVRTVMTKNRCRVLRAVRPEELPGLRDDLRAWRRSWSFEVGGRTLEWMSYPGVFAHGRLDAGTALLLESLPTPPPESRVLDFGCGSGVVGGVLLEREPTLEVELLDVDAVALEAARANVPGARTVLADGLSAVEGERYDRIVANPPYHGGKAETTGTVEELIEGAPALLGPEGALVLVLQRRLRVREDLESSFTVVESLAADATYRVWLCRSPRSRAP